MVPHRRELKGETPMRRKIKAFTLVELLVVISIIALLMGVLVPALGKARELAKRIVCANHLRTMGTGDAMYSQVSEDWHVPIFYNDTALDIDPRTPMWFQNRLFVRIVNLKGRSNEENRDGFEGSMTLPKDFKCPSDRRTLDNGGLHLEAGTIIQGVSYAMNMTNIRPIGGWSLADIAYSLKTFQVVRPAEKIFFMDGQWFAVYSTGAEYKRVWDVHGDKMGAWEWDAASYRHDEGANIAFYDGHVEYWKKERICPYLPGLLEQLKARNAIWLPIPGQGEFFKSH